MDSVEPILNLHSGICLEALGKNHSNNQNRVVRSFFFCAKWPVYLHAQILFCVLLFCGWHTRQHSSSSKFRAGLFNRTEVSVSFLWLSSDWRTTLIVLLENQCACLSYHALFFDDLVSIRFRPNSWILSVWWCSCFTYSHPKEIRSPHLFQNPYP